MNPKECDHCFCKIKQDHEICCMCDTRRYLGWKQNIVYKDTEGGGSGGGYVYKRNENAGWG